jgi:16S rRNA (adenine1518-N6/adenine1519-N6)-dimethyltransferase
LSEPQPAADLSLQRRLDLILKQLDTRPRQRLGQNFMTDRAALEFIRSAAASIPSKAVLEIGPGTGFLTEQLAGLGLPLTAVDADRRFCEALTERFAQDPNVRIIESDILRWEPKGILEPGTLAVGNIPYNITSPILEWLLQRRALWSGVILTVQKEFADRLAAPAGTRECGPISVWMQLHADIRVLKVIGRGAFSPPPKVESSVIRVDFLQEPRYAQGSGPALEKVMRTAFQMRRKQINHAVKGMAGAAAAQAVFAASGVSPEQRPETLSLDQWIALGAALSVRAKSSSS